LALPKPTAERPHSLKYRLIYAVDGARVVGYDNEIGKDDHKHLAVHELPYRVVDVDTLVADIQRKHRVAIPIHSLPSGESRRGGTDKAAAAFIILSSAGTMSVILM
jgi:hypothetical protein